MLHAQIIISHMIYTMFRNDDAKMTFSHYAPEKNVKPFSTKTSFREKKYAFDLGFQHECNGARAHFEWGKDSHEGKLLITHPIQGRTVRT